MAVLARDLAATRVGLSRLHVLWASLFFAALTVVMTWPLVLRMGNQVVGNIGDNIYFVWLIDWVRRAIFELHISPVFVPTLNYPEGWNLAFTEITPAQLAIAIPASFVGGLTFGYNFTLLASFVLSGLGMYLWIHHVTGSKGAALISGTIFAFLPDRMAHFLIGHLNLIGTQWLPFFYLGLYDLLRQPRWAWKPALLAGVSLGLIGYTSQYYTYMTLLVTAVFGIAYLLVMRERIAWIRGAWKNLVGFAAVGGSLVLLSIQPYLQLSNSGGMPNRTIGYVSMYSASPTDFILPSTDHFLWGSFIGSHFNREMWVEGTLYVGAVALVLAILAWAWRREGSHPALVVSLAWMAGFAFVMALGTNLHWNGQPVIVTVPNFLRGWLHKETTIIPLPAYLMFLKFPFFAKMRALMRFGMFVLLPISALAGLGAAWLLKRVPAQWKTWVAALLVLLVFIDFYPGPYQTFTTIQPRPVDNWLALQPDSGAVAQFPFKNEADQQQTYYSMIYHKPFIGGFFAAFEPSQYQRIRPVLEHFPDPSSVSLLRQLGVTYVVVDTSQYPNLSEVEHEMDKQGLRQLTQQSEEAVYGWK